MAILARPPTAPLKQFDPLPPHEGAGFALSGLAILQTKQAVEASHNDQTATPNRAAFKFAITHKIIEGRPAQVAVCAGI